MSDQDLMKSLEFMSVELERWKEKYIKLAELCAENKCEEKIKPEVKYVMKEADVGYFCTALECTIRKVA